MNQILFYERKYYFFSNFSAFAVSWRGVLWMTAEHAYQAAKFMDETIVHLIQEARSAHDTKNIAQANRDKTRPDWQEVKLGIMEEIVRAKLLQYPYIQEMLLESGNVEIIEDSPKDSFWGWGPDRHGQNHLGKIWMKLRAELRMVNEGKK